MQLFGHEDEEYFQLQYGKKGNTTVPFGFTFQGGKASTLGQNPKFKIIDIDQTLLIPQRITVYEYDITKANSPNTTA